MGILTPLNRLWATREEPVAARTTKRTERRRASWGSLSREQVVSAAEAIVARGDFEKMTIRSLAEELGASPMALYRHVRDKDDLLGEVVDRLLRRRWKPRRTRNDWRSWTAEAAERFRAFLVAEPAALHIYLTHPVVAPVNLERMTAMQEVLRSAGFDEIGARHAYAALHTYTIGFAALEASRDKAAAGAAAADELTRELATFTTPRQFAEGLSYLLDGIERRASR